MSGWGVSVVVCCHNSAARLPPTLAHLAAQQVPPALGWEVVLVDNASTDGTAAAARHHWPADAPAPLRVAVEPELGLGNARRRGLAEARFPVISFIDDDNWIAPDWVATAAEVLATHPTVGACGGFSEAVCEREPPDWFDRFTTLYAVGPAPTLAGDVTEHIGQLWGAGLTLRRAAWDALAGGGFRSLLVGRRGAGVGAGEDTELCLALRLGGWRLWLEPRLRLKHFLPAGRLDWRYLRRLHRGSGRATVGFDPYHFALRGGRGVLAALRRRWWWQAAGTLMRIVRHPRTALLMRVSPLEGEAVVLRVEALVGRLGALLRARTGYDRDMRAVDRAPWRAG